MIGSKICLHLFDGDAGAPADAAAGAGETQGVRDAAGQGTTEGVGDKDAQFERLIREEYRDAFTKRVQGIIDRRFKEGKAMEARLKALEAERGGGPGAAQDISPGAEHGAAQDTARQPEARTQDAPSPEQLARARHEAAARAYTGWLRESEALREVYPSFDLRQECKNGKFVGLLRSGVDMRTAFEVTHRDEIIGGAMRYTAQEVKRRLGNDIMTQGARPAENGIAAQSAAMVKPDVRSLSRSEREALSRRVLKGEKITF